MPFLSALLPGVREVRTPFVSGALWLVVIAVVVAPSAGELESWQLFVLLQPWIDRLSVPAALFAASASAYLVGLLAQALSDLVPWPHSTVQHVLQRVSRYDDLTIERRTPSERMAGFLVRPSNDVRFLLRSVVRERLSLISATLRDILDERIVLKEFDLAGLRLSKDAPEQYQQYDRLRTEGEFRLAIAPPVFTLGVALSTILPNVTGNSIGAILVLDGSLLIWQGVKHHHKADDLLASALYFGYTSVPLLDMLHSGAQARMHALEEEDRKAKELAWLCDFLYARDLLLWVQTALERPETWHGTDEDVAKAIGLMLPETVDTLQRYHIVLLDGTVAARRHSEE